MKQYGTVFEGFNWKTFDSWLLYLQSYIEHVWNKIVF